MAEKRPHDDSTAAEYDAPKSQPSKRQRGHDHSSGHRRTKQPDVDFHTGQRYVFGSLQDATVPSDDDLEFEDESDALAYLQAVRQEAGGIPSLLVAAKAGPQLPDADLSNDSDVPNRDIYESGVGDRRGYYQDGAYTAAPDDEDDIAAPAIDPVHEAYYADILARYSSLRDILQQQPPESSVSALPKNNTPIVGNFGPKSNAFAIWNSRLAKSDPLPVQVAAIDRDGAMRLIRVILISKFLRVGSQVTERTSRWLWALLARVPDRTELGHREIGHIRELGKRAVLMMTSIAQVEALRAEVELDEGEVDLDDLLADVDEEMEDGVQRRDAEEPRTASKAHAVVEDEAEDGEINDDEPGANEVPEKSAASNAEDLEAIKARLLANLDTMEVDTEREAAAPTEKETPSDSERAAMNARATLNMILTIAGEFYGQRDLLEFRDPFPGL